MYKVTEYRPNYFETSDEPRVAYIDNLEQLNGIPWLNKDGRKFRCDGYFVRRADSPLILAIITKEERKQTYTIVDATFEFNFELETCFCSCFPNCSEGCPNYKKNTEERKQKIILTIKSNAGKLYQAECEIANIVWRTPE
jgi:hypothetical protein